MLSTVVSIAKRINVAITASTTAEEAAEMQRDPWSKSAKYGVGFVYFAVVLLIITTFVRCWHKWGDKMRIALYKENRPEIFRDDSVPDEYELPSAGTDASNAHFFPSPNAISPPKRRESILASIVPLNKAIAFMRWIFYRPVPSLRVWKIEIVFPSLAITAIVLVAFIFVTLYCFVPQPLYYWSIALGSPPLAIRAGMIAVAMIPWIVALSTKANFITMMTGLGPERLNGLHRWSAYICLFLSLVHMGPFYITPIWEDGALINYSIGIPPHAYVYGTGIAAIVPLLVLCIHSLPIFRNRMYELFVFVHIPVSYIFVAMLFWHTRNYLSSWAYLFTTIAIWVISYTARLFYLNWTHPFRSSFLIGEESAITLLPQNAIKITIPTKMRWRPGQYVYLRLPRISVIQSHPFTIASLCSDDFPSGYGEKYRDMTLVFRPFKGFTRDVFQEALEHGPYKTYSAFVEGPYGGMQREIAAFDDVIFFAGGSGITAIASQLLDLIKKIRDGKAIAKSVKVIWALKSPETMEWFQEELRICRDYAPSNIVSCHFFLTGVQQNDQVGRDTVQEKIYSMLQGIDKRNSAYIRDEAAGNPDIEKELRRENEDGVAALPNAYTATHASNTRQYYQPTMNPHSSVASTGYGSPEFDFGFGTPQTVPQRPPPAPAPRFAYYQPRARDNWRTDYFRPNITQMVNEFSQTFGRRACVFVCGPPSMRVEVANAVAKLQLQVIMDSSRDEIFLHAENYNV
ncbi:Riboflavin synthase-like beta-barrel [Penicillium robsamsonii]|uniref:Riboflavin synthase-like beta-barrel n=1 Tax=Penicillium robsamsonii TaxID=1792511 RepID=UPI00254805F8|nr:Riboflavin synthase-like beta-barrel [Penicillium robsamsonii]KAJ5824861.1 Riboflavin synthase-like beta-barrel [Penicillium robsamsonii]